jgi:acetyl-CoA C-acetyltransferase
VSRISVDDRTPAIVGAAQVIQRPDPSIEFADLRGPYELMLDAARQAADDAGAPLLLRKLDWIGVVGGFWSFQNPAQVIGEKLGSPGAGTCLTMMSGSAPQDLVALASQRIANGELDVALIVGGEARATTEKLKRAGEEPPWLRDLGTGTPERVADFPDEMIVETLELGGPAVFYALFDDSLRRSLGRSVDEHRDEIAKLWARFNEVAVANPYAWDRTPMDAATIREPTPTNRMVAFPYTKSMVAFNVVDMATAVVLCSVDAARSAGISRDRLVFPRACTSSHETWSVTERRRLHEAPALVTAGRTALDAAGLSIDEIQHVDLYACFPSIVQMSAAALGLSLERPLTVTGGLGFAAAPIANSSGHAIAAMVPLLRDGGAGLVHANGGCATKHAFGIYSTDPPEQFRYLDCNDEVDHLARPPGAMGKADGGIEEASTVSYDRNGPTFTATAVLLPDDRRVFVKTPTEDSVAVS